MKILSHNTLDTELLNGLVEDMLYQTWENYPEYNEDEAYYCVLDHVILVITEMDDDEMYSDLLPFASHENEQFCDVVEEMVHNHYDEYNWQDEI